MLTFIVKKFRQSRASYTPPNRKNKSISYFPTQTSLDLQESELYNKLRLSSQKTYVYSIANNSTDQNT